MIEFITGNVETNGTATKYTIEDRQAKTKYPVIHRGHPLCGVIINIENFDTLKKRDGSARDVKQIMDLLDTYGVQYNKEINSTAEGMKDALVKLKEWDLPSYSGLIVTIMTHGGAGNTLYGKDGRKVQLKELAKIFNSAECEGLRNKPKIFIVNACRGSKEDIAERDSIQMPEDSLDQSKYYQTSYFLMSNCVANYLM